MTPLRVTILHQAVSADSPPDERDVLDEVGAIRLALKTLGHRVTVLPMTPSLHAARKALRRTRPDCVFNLVESVMGRGVLACAATALLDAEGIVYTGAGTAAMALTTDKLAAKRALRRAGIATPDWVVAREHQAFSPGSYIIKPIAEDASVGLGEDSLVRVRTLSACQQELVNRGQRMKRSLFAERFIEGREFNISLIGTIDSPRVLPLAEIQFCGFKKLKKPTLVGYRAKWEAESYEYQNTTRSFAVAAADRSLYRTLARFAGDAWNVLGCSGYARVDLRVDRQGCPQVLEVNANPCVLPEAGFMAAARQANMSFAAVVAEILRVAFGN